MTATQHLVEAPATQWSPTGYLSARALTEALAEPLSAEDQTVQSMPDVSPTKWHRAHTTWFFETFVLQPWLPGYRPHDPAFAYLFNSYYEAVGSRHPRTERGLLSRPGIDQVAAYRAHVDHDMAQVLSQGPGPEVEALVTLGIHHEQQHQELLLMDIKHVLSVNPLRPAYRTTPTPGADDGTVTVTVAGLPQHRTGTTGPGTQWVEHPGGLVEVGHDGVGFAFDNEGPRHRAHLEPFAVADRPVTCGEWLAFMADDGYRRHDLWLSDGWQAVQAQRWEAPLYWEQVGDGWHVFTLDGLRPVDPSEPVCHVSLYEADAFAHWAGARLPLEAEWEAVAGQAAATTGEYGASPLQGPAPGIDLDVLHPRPHQGDGWRAGEVWEWTASAYLPYPGFRPAGGAVGEYNGKFMVNQHVLRGGSAFTPPGHARPTYRNFFPASARWACSGVRLARHTP